MAKLWFWRYKDIQGNLGVHQDGVAIVPQEPFQSLILWFCKLLSDDSYDPAVLRPQASDHVLAQDEMRIAMELVVKIVGSDGGLIWWVRLSEGGGALSELRIWAIRRCTLRY